MSKYTVTPRELDTAVTKLTELRTQFQSKLDALLARQGTLAQQWSGEASTAFATAFQNDKAQWDNFGRVLDTYISALKSSSEAYKRAEAANKSTAMTRKH